MLADGFDYKIAAGLHRDRLAEAESIRRAATAKQAAKHAVETDIKLESQPGIELTRSLKRKIGRQLIALGERMTA